MAPTASDTDTLEILSEANWSQPLSTYALIPETMGFLFPFPEILPGLLGFPSYLINGLIGIVISWSQLLRLEHLCRLILRGWHFLVTCGTLHLC